tara:strand:- start:23 stop:301 length:279 start_codon:yes stop_codon:yes gene_type:complete
MKTYILINSNKNINSTDDIHVNAIYGIYQKQKKAIYEACIANNNNSYNIYEIDLTENKITNILKFSGNNTFIDNKKISHHLDINAIENYVRF